MRKKIFFIKAIFTVMVLCTVLLAAGFYSSDAIAYNKTGDLVESHRFTSGDSTFEITLEPGYDTYIEAYDSAGSGTDTFKVYIEAGFADGAINTATKTLAYLSKVNDTNSVSIFTTPTQSNGVIIPGASTTVFYKVNYAAGKILIVRSNAVNLTDVSYVTVRKVPKAKGAILNSLPYDFGLAAPVFKTGKQYHLKL
ncbi:MAG: hypothetical protein IT280_13080 [Ignavibacteria bacterium]|nr:hypothetical protein [Ignavibacteria bacterium]